MSAFYQKWSNRVSVDELNRLCKYLNDAHTSVNTDRKVLVLHGPGATDMYYDILKNLQLPVWRNNCMNNGYETARFICIDSFGSGRDDIGDVEWYTSGTHGTGRNGQPYTLDKHMIVCIDPRVNISPDVSAKLLTYGITAYIA